MLGLWLAAGVAAQADWGYAEEGNAVVLTPQTHDRFLREFEEAVVYYALPDCDHCTDFDGPYSELAFEYKERDHRVPFARVDCKGHLDFCRGVPVPTYPFIKLFLRGHALDYVGPRTKAALRDFVDTALSRGPRTLTAERLVSALRPDGLSLVFIGHRSQEAYRLLDLMSRRDGTAAFFHIEPKEAQGHALFAGLDLAEPGRFVAFKGAAATSCEAAGGLDHLEKCLAEAQSSALVELSDQVVEAMRQGPQRWMFYFGHDWEEVGLSDFDQFAGAHRKQLGFVVALEKSAPPRLLSQFAAAMLVAQGDPWPQVRFVETAFGLEGLVRYALEGPLSQASLRALYRGATERTLHPLLRSEDFDQRPLGNLTAVAGRSFDRLVPSAGRDAVVLYHADLDAHPSSRQMLTDLEKLTAEPENADIAFFCLNADLNELRGFSSPERPVLLLFSRRDPSRPRILAGPASPAALQAFLTSRRKAAKEPVNISLSSEL